MKTFDTLFAELADKARERPTGSRTIAELDSGVHGIGKKIGEEATEVVMAAKDARVNGDNAGVLYECADLWFHTLVMLAQFNLTPDDVLKELARREGVSGIEEKANRKLAEREQEERRD